jgi:hypothetical protein
MISIGSALSSFRSHLPKDWAPSDGLRSLFPAGYSGSISPLKDYVVFVYHQLATQGYAPGASSPSDSCISNFWVMADGQGRWFFGWIYGESYLSSTYLRQAGFVFKYSPDGNGRGYVDSSHPPVLTRSCNAGTDRVIALNWPKMLTGGIHILFQLGSAPNPSDVWTGAGFAKANFVTLSGSTLFPFPVAEKGALDPPAPKFTPLSPPDYYDDAGGGWSASYSTQDDVADPVLSQP